MGLLRRHRPTGLRRADSDDRAALTHLEQFAGSRAGVEAYLEPPTNVTPDTVVLVATTGEWTRRRVPSAKVARDLAGRLGIPVYDVAATGYPRRMREWTARRKAAGDTGVPTTREVG